MECFYPMSHVPSPSVISLSLHTEDEDGENQHSKARKMMKDGFITGTQQRERERESARNRIGSMTKRMDVYQY